MASRKKPLNWRAISLAAVYFLSTNLPLGIAAAAPDVFARVGAGVSRLPLDVMAFDAPGFGDVEDAINLASGNVYLDLGQLSRNNDLKDGDNKGAMFGNWNLTARLRLYGYSKTFAPGSSLSIGEGDGSSLNFDTVTPNFSAVSSWIARYQGVSGAKFYHSRTQTGTQTPEEWIVVVPSGASKVAHYYDHDGNRSIFWGDGEYADYTQNRSQQYLGAKAGDPEGFNTTYKTQLTYKDTNLGLLSKVKDQWGRVTVYDYFPDGTLGDICILVGDETNQETTWARRMAFAYSTIGGQRVVTYMAYRALTGRTGTTTFRNARPITSRWYSFDYEQKNSKVLLKRVKRPTLSDGVSEGSPGAGWRTTTYTYDDAGSKVASVSQTGEPDTSYSYGTSGTYLGTQVTETQGDKRSVYQFDKGGQLRSKKVRDYVSSVKDTDLEWKYQYDPSGFTSSVQEPSGKTTHYAYDARGNLTRQTLYATAVTNTGSGEPGGYVRHTLFDYNADNRLQSAITSSPADGTYGYSATGDYHGYADYSFTSGKQVFTAINTETTTFKVGGAEKRHTTDTYDEQGRLTQSQRVGAGQTRTTTTAYHSGEMWGDYTPGATGDIPAQNAANTKQYGDLPSKVTTGDKSVSYLYDAFGDVAQEIGPNFASDTAGGQKGHLVLRSYNGYGQPVWETVYALKIDNSPIYASRKMWTYYGSGELDSSWEGTPQNVTDYQYATTQDNSLGRLTAVVKPHAKTSYQYDSYGRVSSQLADNAYTTTTSYDTLDRTVKEVRPGGSFVSTSYHPSGEVAQSTLREIDGSDLTTTFQRDSLGRVISRTEPARGAVYYSYDGYDRPTRSEDTGLSMVNAGKERFTYYDYDSEGNLTDMLQIS